MGSRGIISSSAMHAGELVSADLLREDIISTRSTLEFAKRGNLDQKYEQELAPKIKKNTFLFVRS